LALSLTLKTWRWKQNIPPKCWYPSTGLHDVTSQKTSICTMTTTDSSKLKNISCYIESLILPSHTSHDCLLISGNCDFFNSKIAYKSTLYHTVLMPCVLTFLYVALFNFFIWVSYTSNSFPGTVFIIRQYTICLVYII
jgi:hypothetical protein